MKFLFTTTLIALSTLLSAQNVSFEPATSIMDDNAVASVDANFFAEEAVVVSDEFNLDFSASEYYGDIVISYDLNVDADVTLVIEKAGTQTLALVNETQSTGAQKVLWDENIESGKYTIRLTVGSKVQTKTVNLAY